MLSSRAGKEHKRKSKTQADLRSRAEKTAKYLRREGNFVQSNSIRNTAHRHGQIQYTQDQTANSARKIAGNTARKKIHEKVKTPQKENQGIRTLPGSARISRTQPNPAKKAKKRSKEPKLDKKELKPKKTQTRSATAAP